MLTDCFSWAVPHELVPSMNFRLPLRSFGFFGCAHAVRGPGCDRAERQSLLAIWRLAEQYNETEAIRHWTTYADGARAREGEPVSPTGTVSRREKHSRRM